MKNKTFFLLLFFSKCVFAQMTKQDCYIKSSGYYNISEKYVIITNAKEEGSFIVLGNATRCICSEGSIKFDNGFIPYSAIKAVFYGTIKINGYDRKGYYILINATDKKE